MTDAELDALERLANATTPGPWTRHNVHLRDVDDNVFSVQDSIGPPDAIEPVIRCEGGYFPPYGPDAEFICAARDAIPKLIDEVRRLRLLKNAMTNTKWPITSIM